MNKWNNVVKCAELRSLLRENEYSKALALVDEMDLSGIKHIPDLRVIAEVYKKNKSYDEARDIYLSLYDKIQTRRMLYELIYLSAKSQNMEEAEQYYEEFCQKYKGSSDCLVLRYIIDKEKGVDRQTLISYLQELKRVDYSERWGYELAKLYHKARMGEECARECEDLILWFGEGIIVEKAILLKMYYTEGVDISSEGAIEATKDLDAALKIASTIAEQRHRVKEIQKRNDEEVERLKRIRQETRDLIAAQEEELLPRREEVYYQPEEEIMEEPAKEIMEKPVRETLEEPVKRTIKESVRETIDEPEEEIIEEPVKETIDEPMEEIAYQPEESWLQQEADRLQKQVKNMVQEMDKEFGPQESNTKTVPESSEAEEAGSVEMDIIKKLRNQSGEYRPTVRKNRSVRNDVLQGNMLSKSAVREKIQTAESVVKDELKDELKETEPAKIEESGFYEIAKLVEQIKGTSSAHFAILCEDEQEIVKVSRDLAKQLHENKMVTQNMVAKTEAEMLNNSQLEEEITSLKGGCLLIMHAGALSLTTVQSIYQVMRRYKNEISIILSDKEEHLNALFEQHRKLKKMVPYKFRLMNKRG